MRIWLLRVSEVLPLDGENPRLLRTGMLADMLVKQGHEVVWWTSTYNHTEKKLRANAHKDINISDRYTIKLIHGPVYKKNISWQRLLNHYLVARQFRQLAADESKPDLVLSVVPDVMLSYAAVKYAKKNHVPVVLDLRDMWPDIFERVGPPKFRLLIKLACYPLRRMMYYACKNATAILGITDKFVQWGLSYAHRLQRQNDKTFPLAYPSRQPSSEAIEKARQFWEERGLTSDQFIICFVGTLGSQFELKVVIEAARRLGLEYTFVLAGSGDGFKRYQSLAADCENIIMPSRINAAQIWQLLRLSSVGLAPYRSTIDFVASIPNKPIEYFSAGLPVLSSLQGELKEMLAKNQCGLTYENQNIDQLIEYIKRLKSNSDERQVMGARAKALYEKSFVAEKVYAEMVAHLERIAAETKPS